MLIGWRKTLSNSECFLLYFCLLNGIKLFENEFDIYFNKKNILEVVLVRLLNIKIKIIKIRLLIQIILFESLIVERVFWQL